MWEEQRSGNIRRRPGVRGGVSETRRNSELIYEITQIIRSTALLYTDNISQYNRSIDTYNQNIGTLLTLLNNIFNYIATPEVSYPRTISPGLGLQPPAPGLSRPHPPRDRPQEEQNFVNNRSRSDSTEGVSTDTESSVLLFNIIPNLLRSSLMSPGLRLYNINHPRATRQNIIRQDQDQDISNTTYRENLVRDFNRNATIRRILENGFYTTSYVGLQNASGNHTVLEDPSPSPIPLTFNEIIDATQIIRYNAATMEEQRCPISLDDFIQNEQICQIRGCRHYFKPNHLMRWLENHVECPVCRFNLREVRESSSPETTTVQPVVSSENPSTPSVIQEDQTEESQSLPLPNSHGFVRDESSSIPPPSNERRPGDINFFLPILENLLSSTNYHDIEQIPSSVLGSRLSSYARDLLERASASQTLDLSNNLIYTIEIPII